MLCILKEPPCDVLAMAASTLSETSLMVHVRLMSTNSTVPPAPRTSQLAVVSQSILILKSACNCPSGISLSLRWNSPRRSGIENISVAPGLMFCPNKYFFYGLAHSSCVAHAHEFTCRGPVRRRCLGIVKHRKESSVLLD